MRRFEKTDKSLVKRLPTCRIDKTLEAQQVWCRIEGLGSNQGPQYLERVAAAYSDDTNATAPGRSGQGNNGIGMDSHGTSV